MAAPERIKKHIVPLSMENISDSEPVRKTISQENKRTTMVRTAVATLESVFRIPHFARMDVTPAKKAEPSP